MPTTPTWLEEKYNYYAKENILSFFFYHLFIENIKIINKKNIASINKGVC
jgi:hypothetical protein